MCVLSRSREFTYEASFPFHLDGGFQTHKCAEMRSLLGSAAPFLILLHGHETLDLQHTYIPKLDKPKFSKLTHCRMGQITRDEQLDEGHGLTTK
jgi:hypothetical protein